MLSIASSQTVGDEWFSLVVDREIETLRLMNDSWMMNIYFIGEGFTNSPPFLSFERVSFPYPV